jgi:surface polysaccharide O-acyltransferase-like enzyme
METQMGTVKKQRDANFELLRILAMVMVTILHFNAVGKLHGSVELYSFNYYLVSFLEYASICSVNLYVMITGYFMIDRNISLRKVLSLELQVVFYLVGIYLILSGLHIVPFRWLALCKLFFPVTTMQYWFITAYIGLYLLIPFLNKFAQTASQQHYRLLLLISTLLLVILKSLYPNNGVLVGNGHNLIWFLYLYLLAGYLRLFCQKPVKKPFWLLLLYLGLSALQIPIQFLFARLHLDTYTTIGYNLNSPLSLVKTVALFLFFKNIRIRGRVFNGFLRFLGPLVLGVYLLQEHNDLRSYLWGTLLPISRYAHSIWLPAVILAMLAIVFIVGCTIEKLRQWLFSLIGRIPLFRKTRAFLDQKSAALQEKP